MQEIKIRLARIADAEAAMAKGSGFIDPGVPGR
jgi:hypothetical protein